MAWQIAAGMQDVDDDDFVRIVEENEEMLARPREAKILCVIDQDGTALATGLPRHNCLTTLDQFGLVDLGSGAAQSALWSSAQLRQGFVARGVSAASCVSRRGPSLSECIADRICAAALGEITGLGLC